MKLYLIPKTVTDRALAIAETHETATSGDIKFLATAFHELATRFNYAQLLSQEIASKTRLNGPIKDPPDVPDGVAVPTE